MNIAQWLWQQVPELTTQQYEKFGDIRQALDAHYDELSKQSIPDLWLPSVLILYLFGFRDWWPSIQNVVALPPEAEQTDVMHKVIALIEKYQQSKMREENGQ